MSSLFELVKGRANHAYLRDRDRDRARAQSGKNFTCEIKE